MSEQKFQIENFTVHFLYTFMLDNPQIDEVKDSLDNSLREKVKMKKVEIIKGVSIKKTGSGSFLNVYNPYLSIEFPDLLDQHIRWEQTPLGEMVWKGDFKRSMRIYPSGIGILRIEVSVKNNNLPIEKIIQICRMDRYDFPLHFDDPLDKETLHPQTLLTLFENSMSYIAQQMQKKKFNWVDRDRSFGKNDESLLVDDKEIKFQYPYILTAIGIQEDEEKPICEVVEKFKTEVAGIFRVVYSKTINEKFLKEYLSPLVNLSIDSKSFLTLYNRSCLYMYRCAKETEREYSYRLLEPLIETIELLRMRWHSYIIINAILDNEINKMYGLIETKKKSDKFQQIFSDIIKWKKILSTSLEDPITFRRAGGTLNELYEKGMEEFRIKELQDIILSKMTILDRLYNDIREFVKMNRIQKESKRIPKIFIGLIGLIGISGLLQLTKWGEYIKELLNNNLLWGMIIFWTLFIIIIVLSLSYISHKEEE
ncbi:MAG: hypothetical protein QME42_00690 [bacterium]|nr:hypothetical protein [bacterium]